MAQGQSPKEEPCAPITAILKGETALCSGYVFSFETEQWMREEREYNLKLLTNYKQQNSILKSIELAQTDSIKQYSEQQQVLQAEIQQRRNANMYWGVGGVVAGILLTSLIISQSR